MGDENPIRTLGDYSKPSHEGYRNTIELPVGNNVVPLRSDTIRLVQNGCSFHGLRSEDPNQHLKDFLKLMDSLDLDGDNRERTRLLDLALYDNGEVGYGLARILPSRSRKIAFAFIDVAVYHLSAVNRAQKSSQRLMGSSYCSDTSTLSKQNHYLVVEIYSGPHGLLSIAWRFSNEPLLN
ncbi:hypothetical protein Tco_1343843 [Tanacetum coccineum]